MWFVAGPVLSEEIGEGNKVVPFGGVNWIYLTKLVYEYQDVVGARLRCNLWPLETLEKSSTRVDYQQ